MHFTSMCLVSVHNGKAKEKPMAGGEHEGSYGLYMYRMDMVCVRLPDYTVETLR